MEVKADSIWFQDVVKLAYWQTLKKSGHAAAFATYQDQALSHRDAWQFSKPLSVKILSYDPGNNQVNVEMETPVGCLAALGFWTPVPWCNSREGQFSVTALGVGIDNLSFMVQPLF